MLSQLPSSVTSIRVLDDGSSLQVSDIPDFVTHLSYEGGASMFVNAFRSEQWPPRLTSFQTSILPADPPRLSS